MSRGTDIAASAIGSTAAAANAVPVFGQIAGAALGAVGGLVKLFGNIEGPRKKRANRRRAEQARATARQKQVAQRGAQFGTQGAGGQLQTGGAVPIQPTTTMSPQPATPSFQGGVANVPQQTLPGNSNG